mmetsp:Transcript_9836/g.17367  ORF Transcript_9836/g.17367 Transcript_9836/m.17367 type:complete len:243 (-) Transcript_9836:37-765(-)
MRRFGPITPHVTFLTPSNGASGTSGAGPSDLIALHTIKLQVVSVPGTCLNPLEVARMVALPDLLGQSPLAVLIVNVQMSPDMITSTPCNPSVAPVVPSVCALGAVAKASAVILAFLYENIFNPNITPVEPIALFPDVEATIVVLPVELGPQSLERSTLSLRMDPLSSIVMFFKPSGALNSSSSLGNVKSCLRKAFNPRDTPVDPIDLLPKVLATVVDFPDALAAPLLVKSMESMTTGCSTSM